MKTPNHSIIASLFLAFALLWMTITVANQPNAKSSARVVQLELVGPIGPASSDYIDRSLDYADEINASLVIIRLDTPGGLDTAMREIIKKIIASPVPVATYVAPGGARAASAGVYILYASHIAAMAPATNLGAATPVQIGILSDTEEDKPPVQGKPKLENLADHGSVMERKMTNDAVAYLRGLANLRGRNGEWAEKAVRDSVSLPAEEALKLKVIDLIAADTHDLLTQIEGRAVNVLGQSVKLNLSGADIEVSEPDWRNRLLSGIANPNVAYILMLIGIYGLILEFAHPGAVAPGTIGAICLLLALYALQALSVNYAGLALILLGIGLMIAEAFAPSFGILGIGGITSFVFGSVILVDMDLSGEGLSPILIISFAVSSFLICIVTTGLLMKVRRKPVVTGREKMIGSTGTAMEDFASEGRVWIHSETWSARTEIPVMKNQTVLVKDIEGLTLNIIPQQNEKGE